MRPTSRPSSPYSISEILDRVHQHFVVEQNPRCTNSGGLCIYGSTGCAVGCLFTQADADLIDRLFENPTIRSLMADRSNPHITNLLPHYFSPSPETLTVLTQLQWTHDSRGESEPLPNRMDQIITKLRSTYVR